MDVETMRTLDSFILYDIYSSSFFSKFDELFQPVARFWNVRQSFVSHFKRAYLGIVCFYARRHLFTSAIPRLRIQIFNLMPSGWWWSHYLSWISFLENLHLPYIFWSGHSSQRYLSLGSLDSVNVGVGNVSSANLAL